MKQESIDFLEANRHHYDTIVKAGYVKHLNAYERDGMVRVMREEFVPGYSTDLWCGPCVFDMVKLLYQRYDLWLSLHPKEEAKPEDPPVVIEKIRATFPKQDSLQINSNDQHSSIDIHTPHSGNRAKRHHRRK